MIDRQTNTRTRIKIARARFLLVSLRTKLYKLYSAPILLKIKELHKKQEKEHQSIDFQPLTLVALRYQFLLPAGWLAIGQPAEQKYYIPVSPYAIPERKK